MAKRLGRNEKCWCGSGKKYKKCHLNRNESEPFNLWEGDRERQKVFSKKYCMAPPEFKHLCKKKIVQAHTVAKSSCLKKICSSDGHIYRVKPSTDMFMKTNGKIVPKLEGINRASTFTGFCQFHDDDIFKPLEKEPFSGTILQYFLLAYRAIARENFMKISLNQFLPTLREVDRGRSIDEQESIQNHIQSFESGTNAGVISSTFYKTLVDRKLVEQDFSSVRYYKIELKEVPDTLCSGGIFPEYDFTGNMLQDLSEIDIIPDMLTVSSIATPKGGALIFVWFKEKERRIVDFLESLIHLPQSKIPNALVRLMFEQIENIFLAPKWWEKLRHKEKTMLMDRTLSGLPIPIPPYMRTNTCLMDDGGKYVDWKITGITTNTNL